MIAKVANNSVNFLKVTGSFGKVRPCCPRPRSPPVPSSGMPVHGSSWRLRGFHQHQAQHFHCNLPPAQPLETIIFQQDDAPWNLTSSSASSSARKGTGSFFLHSVHLNRHKGRPGRSSTDQRLPAHHSLLNFLGKGIIKISLFFPS